MDGMSPGLPDSFRVRVLLVSVDMCRSLPTSEELVKTCLMPQCFDLRKSAVELVIKKMSSGRLPGRTGAHS
jgi:hypothetical protein